MQSVRLFLCVLTLILIPGVVDTLPRYPINLNLSLLTNIESFAFFGRTTTPTNVNRMIGSIPVSAPFQTFLLAGNLCLQSWLVLMDSLDRFPSEVSLYLAYSALPPNRDAINMLNVHQCRFMVLGNVTSYLYVFTTVRRFTCINILS